MKAYIIYAILAALFASFVPIFGKLGLKDIDSTLATAVRAVVMAVFLIAVAASTGALRDIGTIDSRSLLLISLSGLAGALSWLFYFMAIKGGKVPAVVAIDKTSVALAILFSWIILNSEMNARTAVGAILIVIGAILTAL